MKRALFIVALWAFTAQGASDPFADWTDDPEAPPARGSYLGFTLEAGPNGRWGVGTYFDVAAVAPWGVLGSFNYVELDTTTNQGEGRLGAGATWALGELEALVVYGRGPSTSTTLGFTTELRLLATVVDPWSTLFAVGFSEFHYALPSQGAGNTLTEVGLRNPQLTLSLSQEVGAGLSLYGTSTWHGYNIAADSLSQLIESGRLFPSTANGAITTYPSHELGLGVRGTLGSRWPWSFTFYRIGLYTETSPAFALSPSAGYRFAPLWVARLTTTVTHQSGSTGWLLSALLEWSP